MSKHRNSDQPMRVSHRVIVLGLVIMLAVWIWVLVAKLLPMTVMVFMLILAWSAVLVPWRWVRGRWG